MLIVTKMVLAGGMAALAMGGPAGVDPALPGTSVVPTAAGQGDLVRQMQAIPPCQAGCNLWQALALRQ